MAATSIVACFERLAEEVASCRSRVVHLVGVKQTVLRFVPSNRGHSGMTDVLVATWLLHFYF